MRAAAIAGYALAIAGAAVAWEGAWGQDGGTRVFPPAQVKLGADIFERNCAPCHGPRMLPSDAAFDLRKFPPDQKGRFVTSVTKGKNQMPPWGDLFKGEEIDALWAYVMAGEKQ
jgi:mono/diheme cytochrome c family protein